MLPRPLKIALKSVYWWSRPYYLSDPSTWNLRLRMDDQRIALNHEHKFVYVRVPKAANSTVTGHLYRALHGRAPDSADQAKESFHTPLTLTYSQAQTVRQNYFKFTFVRNPYSRILSAYLDKIARADQMEFFRDFVRARLKRPVDHTLSFEEFCRYLECGGIKDDAHWAPQTDMMRLIGGADNLNFTGKVETLHQDIALLFPQIFPDYKPDFLQSDMHNKTGAQDKIEQHYTLACRDIIRNLYKDDFEIFDYDPQHLS